ncbi:Ankyrin repeat-containing protein [Mycena venus]|uniref:Ankyrin repeat-containing protein n=1 Tax=Mycena venus TaxID=2733690 RepID=A0A8H7CKW4_9AGAR|nr:Ankyrin repeat-containing protein [Mycena venus]
MIRSLRQTISVLENAHEDQRIDQNYISRSVRDVARKQERHFSAVERDEIIQWISPLNFFPRQADIFNARQPGTGGWLLEDASFIKWKSGSIDTVWCRGMPGAGKTVLCAIVVDHLRKSLDNENIRIAVVYLNHKETEAQSPSNVLASIWRQLIIEQPLSSTVEKLYVKHREQRTRPSLDDTHGVLCSTVSQLSRVFIVVDALDEYPEEQWDTLLERLSILGPSVTLMVTSRPHINIKHVIPEFEVIEIRAAKDDIRQYLEGQIRKSQRLSRHVKNAPDVRQALETRIVEGSDGMFLLAKLHIDSLTTKHTVKALREALNNMPEDLDGTYDEVVARINQQSRDDRELAWHSLSWITHAKRRLRPSELREALAVEPGSAKLDPENLLDADSILSVCAGLVVIDEEDDTIRLVHYTMQNYLEQRQTGEFPYASTNITMTCLTYLSFEVFVQKVYRENPQSLFSAHPFLDYAVEYCFIHACGDPEEHIQENIVSFLGNCSVWRELWNRTKFPTVSAARLWIAAAFQLEIICRYLIQEDGLGRVLQDASLKGRTDMVQVLLKSRTPTESIPLEYGHALAAVAGRGHSEIIHLLVYAGAKLDTKGKDYGTALCAASFRGNYKIVQLLVEHRADINANGPKGTPLQAACSSGHEAIARLLLESGADIDSAGEQALLAASLRGDAAIVALLLEYGTDPYTIGKNLLQMAVAAEHESVARVLLEYELTKRNELDADRWIPSAVWAAFHEGKDTMVRLLMDLDPGVALRLPDDALDAALQGMSERGDTTTVGLLLDHGADPNAQFGQYGSALQRASGTGHEEIVNNLIKHGADVDASGPFGSALQRASAAGHEKIAKILIQHGADINAMGPEGSALQRASGKGHAAIAKFLIQHGADINALGPEGSALERALQRGHTEMANILIQHGANVNANGPFGSALQRASAKGHTAIAKFLIYHGADVNANGPFGSALHRASVEGHKEIAIILIQHGANINVNGPSGISVLQAAVMKGHTALARILIQHGAHINVNGPSGTALQSASADGHEEIAEILIQHGDDVNAALQSASAGGHNEIVRILVQLGADINASGVFGSALQRASVEGHEGVVKILIQHSADVKANAASSYNILDATIRRGHTAIVGILLEHGAYVNTSTLQRAATWGSRAIFEILIAHGADVNASGPNGTALEIATRLGRREIVTLLREHGARGQGGNA